MTFQEYQKLSRETAIYPNADKNFIYPALGLAGETGEVAEIIKRIIRDKNGLADEETKAMLIKELGDVLWYLSQLATEFGLSLDEIAADNIKKLQDRKARGALHGKGDNR
ncbi:MAG: nucleoside triphosphate pyrophosphohydrolase family protein [Candidatus Wildermuthbacteria bacterium]|nr:nucleoside triphosphate pyrophosphohydrolase family protein [Candidatus Wildermuthbacteria bacterium]